jgi:6-phosphofructokinase 1
VLNHTFDLPVIGVPGTIDNDIPGTDWSIGFDTALNIAIEAVGKVRDTATSHGRIFVIEVMGRSCGLLAIQSGIACGAEEVLVPEIPFDLDEICRRIDKGYDRGKRHAIIIVAEGAAKASVITYEMKNRLQRGIRMVVLGHVQRGGSPSAFDRILATRLGSYATEILFEGKRGVMVGLVANRFKTSPLRKSNYRMDKVVAHYAVLQRLLA